MRDRTFRRVRRMPGSAALLIAIAVGACEDKEPVGIPIYDVEMVGGDGQVAATRTELSSSLVVRVLDTKGRPVPGVRVAWTVEEQGGFVSSASLPSLTDARGLARVRRTLGPDAGVFGTLATVDEAVAPTVRFTSVAQVQGAVFMALAPDEDGAERRDTVFSTVRPFRVVVVDQHHRPVAGVEVYWSYAGDGSISVKRSITGLDGIAETTHTLGPTSGLHAISAHVHHLAGSPIYFKTMSEPGAPVAIETDQRPHHFGVVAETLEPFVVRAVDSYGNRVPGVAVEWSVTGGGGNVQPARAITASGAEPVGPFVSATHTLGSEEGLNAVTAIAPDIPGAPSLLFETHAVSAIVWVLTIETWCYYGYYYCDYVTEEVFSPDDVVVPVGRTVAWIWGCTDSESCPAHDVVFADVPTPPTSSPLQNVGYHLRTFREPGRYDYRCTEHSPSFSEGMVGVVRVE
jgi:hypothetical protein